MKVAPDHSEFKPVAIPGPSSSPSTEEEKKPLMYAGLPYEGDALPMVKPDDPEHRKPQISRAFRIKCFDTSNEEDIQEYEEICNRILTGQSELVSENLNFHATSGAYKILLKWTNCTYKEPTNERREG